MECIKDSIIEILDSRYTAIDDGYSINPIDCTILMLTEIDYIFDNFSQYLESKDIGKITSLLEDFGIDSSCVLELSSEAGSIYFDNLWNRITQDNENRGTNDDNMRITNP